MAVRWFPVAAISLLASLLVVGCDAPIHIQVVVEIADQGRRII